MKKFLIQFIVINILSITNLNAKSLYGTYSISDYESFLDVYEITRPQLIDISANYYERFYDTLQSALDHVIIPSSDEIIDVDHYGVSLDKPLFLLKKVVIRQRLDRKSKVVAVISPKINSLNVDIQHCSCSDTGYAMILCDSGSSIENIKGNFIGNSIGNSVYVTSGNIENVEVSFDKNMFGSSMGYVFRNSGGEIKCMKANFTGNSYDSSYGINCGIIDNINSGNIEYLKGNFSNNIDFIILKNSSDCNMNVTGTFIGNKSNKSSSLIHGSGKITINDSIFSNNIFEGSSSYSDPSLIGCSDIVFNDSKFSGNCIRMTGPQESYDVYYNCGVIFAGNVAEFNLSAGKKINNVGNYVEYNGRKLDECGGFLYIDQESVVNFNMDKDASYIIGDGRSGYDSIAATGAVNAIINKNGKGELIVNSSMEFLFYVTLNVNEGVMYANKGLGVSEINIANGATLNVGLTLKSFLDHKGFDCYVTVVNNGVLCLKRGTLADGEAIRFYSYSGEGIVKAFGGSFENGKFTAGKSTEFTSNSITVGSAEDDVQSVSYTTLNNNKLILDFDVSGKETMVVNSITEVEASEARNIQGAFITGFSVDATYSEDLSVLFSAYVGEIEDSTNLLAWHKENGSDVWTQIDATIGYDASTGLASIFVEGFSSYAISQIPEPSTYAMVFGAIALGFVAYRKRK